MTVTHPQLPDRSDIQALVERMIEEDIGSGDLTASLVQENVEASARLICLERAVLCGVAWAQMLCEIVDRNLSVSWQFQEGEVMHADATVCQIRGLARSVLSVERSFINILQTLSATATVAHQHSEQLKGTKTTLLDTRKTIPGLRLAQKYAVAVGGGQNHRIGLFDGILIKENHIAAAGSITNAITRAKEVVPHGCLLEVEVESLEQLSEAIAAGAPRIMLDNFSREEMVAAVKLNNGAAKLEVSGNVGLDELSSIAETGVDFVSVGALTKHVRAVDFSLRITYTN